MEQSTRTSEHATTHRRSRPRHSATRQRLVASTLAMIAVASLTACHRTIRTTLQMHPNSFALVRLQGDKPFVQVQNRGPGAVDVMFNTGIPIDPGSGRDTISAGSSIGSTVYGAREVRVETGASSGATVVITGSRVAGATIDGPKPK